MLTDPKGIRIEDYDYPLPDERIAKYPLAERDESKLLVYRGGEIGESQFKNVADYLSEGTMLVFNNTKVIHARLLFQKESGSRIEVFCLEPYNMAVSQAFEERGECKWLCFIGNNKKWKQGALSRRVMIGEEEVELKAERGEAVGNAWIVDFKWEKGVSFAELLDKTGQIPLPPYLHREAEASDSERYQTIYAEPEGSVAAPTAGLHFTDRVFNALRNKSIDTEFITLHVGAGTFKPVSSEEIGGHEMHVEKIAMSSDNIRNIAEHRGERLVAVGTTSVRTIESVYWFGVKLKCEPNLEEMHVGQWDPYEYEGRSVSLQESYANVLEWLDRHDREELNGDTQLMIAPGYKYHVINGIITNFHQPKSTLLLLVSAFIGEDWRRCYEYAMNHGFRFLSYGDSCLFLK